MKFIGTYTARGQIQTDSSLNRINVFDGDYTTGYKLTRISIAQSDIDEVTSVDGIAAKVVTTDDPAETAASWNWANNQEIAWSYWCHDANFISPITFSEVDRDNLIIEDCYITAHRASGGTVTLNYMLEFDKFELEPLRGTISMVQNRSQG
tara:strand:- start:395 stop:847 length:453 start_codon:yes stop_codon:yes gene_type:complete